MSKIQIINRALLKLGEPPISSLNDAAFGKTYDIVYNDMKKLLLSAYPWRFAVDIKQLAKKTEKYDDKFVYQLPLDRLLLIKVFGNKQNDISDMRAYSKQGYEVANNCINTHQNNNLKVEYVKNIDDDILFPPLFTEALAAKMGAELAMRIKHSVAIKQNLDAEFYNFIMQAEYNNEIIKDVELIPDNSWILVRDCW